jgi:PAS domain S-box-containing protein
MAVGGELVGFLGFDSTRMEMEWTQDAITLLNIVGAIIADALQRKASEDELRKEATFSTAVLNSSGAMCIVLNTSAQIVRFNTAAEQVTGYTAAEVLGRPPWDLFISKDELPLMRRIFRRLASGSPPVSQEGSVISKTREKAAVSWLLTSITNRDDQVDFVILSGLDVSEMKRLEAEVLDVSEREQSRFGHDLHDGLGQHLTGIEFMARVLEQKLESENHPLSAQASQITALVRDAISQTRDLARGLSPVVLQAKGIGVALADLAKSVSKRHSIACDCHIAENCEIQRLETATHLYRIAQEAVNNALKHADPKKIIISLTRENDRFVLCVEDDGKAGFAPSGQGMGLRVMNYRAGIIGGTMEIEQKPKGGVMVICRCE